LKNAINNLKGAQFKPDLSGPKSLKIWKKLTERADTVPRKSLTHFNTFVTTLCYGEVDGQPSITTA
jgi:hypothetical protein